MEQYDREGDWHNQTGYVDNELILTEVASDAIVDLSKGVVYSAHSKMWPIVISLLGQFPRKALRIASLQNHCS